MSTTIQIPQEYGYVLLAAASTSLVNCYHTYLTSRARPAAKVKYPNAYAPASEAATSKEKYTFNCAQSAHRNFGENQTTFLISMLISGLRYPVFSAWMGAAWSVSRTIYAWGYVRSSKPDGKGRMYGTWWQIPHVILIGTALWTGFSSVKSSFGL